jgi:ESAT-6 protein secretion system EspG family protein
VTVRTGAPSVHFRQIELDLLATHAGVPVPFPIRVASFGRFADERAALLAEAGHALCDRGLATASEPTGLAARLVTALCGYRSAIDLVVVDADTVAGVVAMVCADWALVCRQALGAEPADTVEVRHLPLDELADELADLIPAVPAAVTMPITLPPGVVDAARLLATTADRDGVAELIREHRGEDVVDQLDTLIPAVTGRGQLGVVRRSGSAGRPFELSWLDSPRGRVKVSTGEHGWMSVNSLRRGDIVQLVREAVTLARG